MKKSETQPLEEATPVVPETAAIGAPDAEDRRPDGAPAAGPPAKPTRDDARPTDAAGDEPSESHYPPAPTGSAGHP